MMTFNKPELLQCITTKERRDEDTVGFQNSFDLCERVWQVIHLFEQPNHKRLKIK
jgi:hypothetical protein